MVKLRLFKALLMGRVRREEDIRILFRVQHIVLTLPHTSSSCYCTGQTAEESFDQKLTAVGEVLTTPMQGETLKIKVG